MVQTTLSKSKAFDDQVLEQLAKRFGVDKHHWMVEFAYEDEIERLRRQSVVTAIKDVTR